ncbi:hypothetical protein [Salinibacterium sp.]|uniref:hypothetical protein n=1 Tax=Salinibacterium sp. TaxID=1915057 RepID=UPI00286C3636|nr:hypothetical protein [Salinibacterium sp.]
MPTEFVYLYRGNINALGKLIRRGELPAGSERLSIQHWVNNTELGALDAAEGDVSLVEVYRVR